MPADTTIAPASHPGNPIPCHIDVRCPAALHIVIDQDNNLVVVRLAADEDARLYLSPEGGQMLGALEDFAGRDETPNQSEKHGEKAGDQRRERERASVLVLVLLPFRR